MDGVKKHAVFFCKKGSHVFPSQLKGYEYVEWTKMEEICLTHYTQNMTKKINNDKNHKKINNQLNDFKAKIRKIAKQLQAEPKIWFVYKKTCSPKVGVNDPKHTT